MARTTKAGNGAHLALFDVQEYLKTAPCVPLLRQKVGEWREGGYKGATDVSRQLLQWWFANDHCLPDGRLFEYHRSQREAIETLIYAYEVAYKDRAARLWCENATMLTGRTWEYIKVPQKDFYQMQPALFSDITLMR